LSLPEYIGRYVLVEELAKGGMAQVYLGRLLGPMGFGRTVALKRLFATVDGVPQNMAGLLDEARFAARVRHGNVVPTLDVIEHEGEIILVMEYVHGESLAKLISAARRRAQRIPPNIIAAVAIDALHGLHAAHEATAEDGLALGLIHRDVSPQNIMVSTQGVTQLLDFGIAQASANPAMVKERVIKGKIAYMAPEQVRDEPLDRRTDVWAMGVVLWQMLTGRSLFAAEDNGQLVGRVLEQPIPSPGEVTGVPSPLDEVVLWSLQRDKSQRPETALNMALSIEQAVAPATARVVAEWVDSLAADALRHRSEQLTRTESFQFDPLYTVSQTRSLGPHATPQRPSRPPPLAGAPKGVVRPGVSQTAAEEKPALRQWWVLVGIAMLLVGLSAVLWILMAAPEPAAAEVPVPAPVVPIAPTPLKEPLEAQGVGDTPEPAAPVEAEKTPTIDPEPQAEATMAPVAKPRPKMTGAKKKKNCNPPFTIGPAPDYIQVPKLECLE
jgi:eukaryotic-like serine/threonine-protein kinase